MPELNVSNAFLVWQILCMLFGFRERIEMFFCLSVLKSLLSGRKPFQQLL